MQHGLGHFSAFQMHLIQYESVKEEIKLKELAENDHVAEDIVINIHYSKALANG